jgi:hypothetical protein
MKTARIFRIGTVGDQTVVEATESLHLNITTISYSNNFKTISANTRNIDLIL